MTDEELRKHNALKLREISQEHRQAFRKVVRTLEAHGHRPRITEAYRTPERQAELYAARVSRAKSGGKHTRSQGVHPASLAADIVCDHLPFAESPAFFASLACAAKREGLVTGLTWGLPQSIRENLQKAIDNLDLPVVQRIVTYKRGWDPCHVEVP